MDNLAEFFKEKTALFSKSIFLRMERDGEEVLLSYRQVKELSEKLKNSLSSLGFKKQDKIAILCENRPEWGIVFWATLLLGAVLVPVDIKLTGEEIEFILKDSGARAVFCSEKFLKQAGNFTIPIQVYSLDNVEPSDFTSLTKLLDRTFKISGDVEIFPHDTALIVYTSGTTGSAKGVVLSHGNILSNVNMVHNLFYLEFSKAGFLSILPLHHTFEITGGFLAPLSMGGSITYLEDFKIETLIKNLKEYKPCVMLVVPSFLNLLYEGIVKKARSNPIKFFIFNFFLKISSVFYFFKIKAGRLLFSSLFKNFGGNLRYFISGAAALDINLAKKLEVLGFDVLEGYGLTEASPILTVNTIKGKKLGSVGKPLPWIQIRIEKKQGGTDGQIVAKGPNVMQGYYKRKDLTDEVLKDGWLYTGDIGYFDTDGFLYICGRQKNIIITSSGKNVYPEELEEKLIKAPLIKEICILGVKRKTGEGIMAIVVPEEEMIEDKAKKEEIIKDVIDNFNKTLPEYKRIVDFIIRKEALPKTTTLKIKRQALAEEIEKKQTSRKQKDLNFTKEAARKDPFVEKLLKAAGESAKISKNLISLKDRLYEDLGVDSLAKLEFASEVENEFQIQIKDEAVAGFYTLEDIYNYLKESPAKMEKEKNLPSLKEPDLPVKFLRYSFHLFYRLFARLFFRLRFFGMENLPQSCPYILAPNHGGHIDLPSILCAFSLKDLNNIFSPAAGDYFQRHPKTQFWSYAFFNTFSFSRLGNYFEGLKACIKILERGSSLVIFPEGFLTRDGTLGEFKSGIGEIACESGAKVVPVYIKGSFEAYPTGRYYPKPCRVSIYFGKPVEVSGFDRSNLPKHVIYKEISQKIKERIASLKDEVDHVFFKRALK